MRRFIYVFLAVAMLSFGHAVAQSPAELVAQNIRVDVTAANANAARDTAITDGLRKAFLQVAGNMVAPEQRAALRAPDDLPLQRMVLDFSIDSERASGVRYLASMTVRFDSAQVTKYLQDHALPYSVPVTSSTKPALIIPILTLSGRAIFCEADNIWRAEMVKLAGAGNIIPICDADDMANLNATAALSGNWTALSALQRKYDAGKVMVATAQAAVLQSSQAIAVRIQEYDQSGVVGVRDLTIPSGQWPDAAQKTLAAISEPMQKQAVVTPAQQSRVKCVVPVENLNVWVEMKRRLERVSSIRSVQVEQIRQGELNIVMDIFGDIEGLRASLTDLGMMLDTGTTPPRLIFTQAR